MSHADGQLIAPARIEADDTPELAAIRATDARRTQDRRFELLVVPEIAAMRRVARALTLDDADADDLVQDALMRAYCGLEGFDGRHVRAWLFTILRNVHKSRFKRRRPMLVELIHERADHDVVDDRADVESEVLQREFVDDIRKRLSLLPPRLRATMELVDVAGWSYSQAAAALETPEGTVMSRLHRARRRMRDGFDV